MRALASSVALVFGLLTLALPGSARGEQAPGFALLDRTDDQTKIATSLGFSSVDAPGASGQRFDLHGQYMHPQLGWGGYGVLTWGRISSDFGSESGLGNLEVGGLYAIPGDVPVILRGGIALETASDDDAFIALITGVHRITDAGAHMPDTTSLRLSVSPMLRQGQGYFRADAGLDLPLGHDFVDMFLRFNVAGGIDLGGVALQGELVNIIEISDGDNDTVHVLGLGVRYLDHPVVQPSLTLAIPLDSDVRDLIDFVLVIGVDFKIPTGGPV
jgi:hypothetical protein